MTSVRGALGLVGTALVGRLSDRNETILASTLGRIGLVSVSLSSGRRACLYVGILATLMGFVVAASMDSLQGLWLSMIPGALLQHNFDVFKALLSEYHNDIELIETTAKKDNDGDNDKESNTLTSSSSSRSGSVGKLGMAAGISFMIGPMISAVSSPSFQFAVYLAMFCTIASGIMILRLPLPVSTCDAQTDDSKNNSDDTSNEKKNEKSQFTFMNMLQLKTPTVRAAATLLVIRLNMALAFHIFNTIWPTSLKARFQFGPSDHAKFMSFIGVTYAVSQGFLAKRVIQFCGARGKVQIIMTCCLILGVGRYVAYYTDSLTIMYMSFLFIINALGILNTVITADTGSIAPSNELGGLFGILQSAESAAGMIGPVLGGAISHYFGDNGDISAPLMAVLGIYGFLFTFCWWGYDKLIVSCSNGLAKKSM
jgi:MFS family permease